VSDAGEVIAALGLEPHPEGGWFRETWRAEAGGDGERSTGSAIYYLLAAGEVSRWHRIDAAEVWHFYAGDPLLLTISPCGVATAAHTLGPDVAGGHRPQVVVPVRAWQSALPLGRWALVGCTVSPAFDFAGFELAPDGWEPGPLPTPGPA